MNHLALSAQLVLLTTFLFSCRCIVSAKKPYTWPAGTCSSFKTCQDCVVETAYMNANTFYYLPCTWDGKDTCLIRADMPSCVYFQYSFWFAEDAEPKTRGQCNQEFAYDFAKVEADDGECVLYFVFGSNISVCQILTHVSS